MLELALSEVEELGHEQLLYFCSEQLQAIQLVIRCDGRARVKISDKLPLRFDLPGLYYFDPRGRTIYP